VVSVVSLLVIAVTPTKTTEPIEVVLGAWPRVGSSTMSWMGARFSLGEKAFWGGGISQLDVNIMEYPAILSTLFGRWQHRCGLRRTAATCLSARDREAEYCDERVCLSVCLSVSIFVCPRSYLRNYKCDLLQIFVRVTSDRGSVLVVRRSDMLRISGLRMTSYLHINRDQPRKPPTPGDRVWATFYCLSDVYT